MRNRTIRRAVFAAAIASAARVVSPEGAVVSISTSSR